MSGENIGFGWLAAKMAELPDREPVPSGVYEVELKRLEMRTSKNEEKGHAGDKYMQAIMSIPSRPTAKEVQNFVAFLPKQDATAESVEAIEAKERIVGFLKGFGLGVEVFQQFEPERESGVSVCRAVDGRRAVASIKLGKNGRTGVPENSFGGFQATAGAQAQVAPPTQWT